MGTMIPVLCSHYDGTISLPYSKYPIYLLLAIFIIVSDQVSIWVSFCHNNDAMMPTIHAIYKSTYFSHSSMDHWGWLCRFGLKPAPLVFHLGTSEPLRMCPSKGRKQKFQDEWVKTQVPLQAWAQNWPTFTLSYSISQSKSRDSAQ